jgi:hypothetical protein
MQIKRQQHPSETIISATIILFCAIVLLAIPVARVSAGAGQGRECPRAEAKGADGSQLEFRQFQFPDGTSDLILSCQAEDGTTDIKRVTYGGSKSDSCLFQSVAIVPGGGNQQWGWHLAWAGETGLRYARMDGNAWVSSPPKRLSRVRSSEVRLQVNGNELLIWWHEQHGDRIEIYQSVSHDEGRNWEAPQQFHSAN